MAFLTLSEVWEDVFQIEVTTPVLGGPNGPMNNQGKQLGNRTEWLKGKLDALGILGAAEFTGDLATLAVSGFYLVRSTATNKPSSGNGLCLVINGEYTGPQVRTTHIYIDELQKLYIRVYVNGSAVDVWNEYLSKAVYEAQRLAEVGQLALFATSASKDGWLISLGQDVSRTTYANLFAVIGETYGAGNGTTTFGLPDFENIPAVPSGSGSFSYFIKY